MLAWKKHLNTHCVQPFLSCAPFLTGVGVFAAILLVWQAFIHNEHVLIHKNIDTELSALALTIADRLNNDVLSLRRMGKRWEAQGGTPQAQWQADAENYYSDQKRYHAIEWVDASLTIRWVVPPNKGTSESLNRVVPEKGRSILEKALNQNEVTFTPTFDLAQGEKGFAAYIPLFVEERFDGFICGVFSLNKLFEMLLPPEEREHFAISVLEANEVVFEHLPSAFSHQTLWWHEQTLSLYGHTWKIKLAHNNELLTARRSNLSPMVLLLGILLALAATLMLFFFQNSKFQQRQLAQQHQELQAIFQAFPDLYLWLDLEGRFIGYQGSGQFYGNPETYIGKSYKEIYPPELIQIIEPTIEQVIQTRQPAQTEYEIAIDGKIQHREGRMLPLGDDKLLVIVREITDRKKAEKELEESKFFLETIAKNSPNLIYLVDLETTEVLFKNTSVPRLLGYCKEDVGEVADWPIFGVHPEDLETMKHRFQRIRELRDDEVHQSTIRAKHADGTWHWILNQERIFKRDPQGQPTQFIGTSQDVTPLKHAELEAQQAKKEAEAANQAKSEFLAAMSHEIRTPLNAIMGMAEFLEETHLNAEQQQHVASILKGGDTLLHLINDILDLSKIEAGQLELEEAPFDLSEIVEQQMEIVAFSAHRKDLELSHRFEPNTPVHWVGDAGRLRQILFNLLGNAIKFTPSGTIQLLIQSVPLSAAPSHNLRFSVKDSGIGIPLEKQRLIFEQFSQADASTTRQFGGTGLGLSICKHLVEAMGGRIGVESKLGESSTFFFTLPLEPAANLPAPESKPAPPPPSSKEKNTLSPFRVLLVEDEPINQQIMRQQLERIGGTVEVAENGAHALEAFQTKPYDFVLMDMQMPIMDGYTATAKLRAWEQEQQRRPTPVVALTAYSLKEALQQCLEVGCNDYLTKPVNRSMLLQKVQELLKFSPEPAPQEFVPPVLESRKRSAYRVQMPEIFADLIPDIMKNKQQQFQQLMAALEQKDFQTIGFVSHQLKGSHHMERVNELGKAMEAAAKHQQLAALKAMLGELEDFLNNVEFETT